MSHPQRNHRPDIAKVQSLPLRGRLLGIDFGTVRVGIAICDESQSIASPLETYTRRSDQLDAGYFQQLVERENAVGVVVGLPIHMSGDESGKSLEAREYGNWLAEIVGLPIAWIDERYSTALAQELLAIGHLTTKQRKLRLDKIAAQTILASYLESNRDHRVPGQDVND